MNIITKHPTVAILGIGLEITLDIGTALGIGDHSQAFAMSCPIRASGCVPWLDGHLY